MTFHIDTVAPTSIDANNDNTSSSSDFPGNMDNRLRVREEAYTNDLSTPLPSHVTAVLEELTQETMRDFKTHFMMVNETQRKLLFQLIQLFNATRVLEIGTFTGAAGITMASALPATNDSKLVSVDIDPKAQAVAHKYIKKLNYQDRVDLRLGPAIECLESYVKEQPGKQFDFVFIDADKPGYRSYFDFIMDHNLLSDHGVIIADNVLFYGQVHRHAGYEAKKPVKSTRDIAGMSKLVHEFNQHVLQDMRVQVIMLPLFDGVSIITKKPQHAKL